MSEKYSTRYTLIERAIKNDDQKAWNEIVQFYQGFIYFLLHSMELSKDDCDELLQIVSVQLWQSLHRFDAVNRTTKFRYWVRQITKNQAYAYLKKRSRYNAKVEKLKESESEGNYELPESSKRVEQEEHEWKIFLSNTALANIKKDFSSKALKAFSMYHDGKATDEIAQSLDVPADSIYKYISRIRERLSKEIKCLSEELDF